MVTRHVVMLVVLSLFTSEVLTHKVALKHNLFANSLKLIRTCCLATTISFASVSTPVPTQVGTTNLCISVQAAHASNLPTSNGASGKMRGTVEALTPIIKMGQLVDQSIAALPNLDEVDRILNQNTAMSPERSSTDGKSFIPRAERDFKRIFDEYSLDVSYKQRYLDSNAFVVYYTQGFDGPNRPSIEEEDPYQKLMVSQYGYRNDAWVGIDEARAELDYLKVTFGNSVTNKDIKDLRQYLQQTKQAIDNYVHLAPPADIEVAKSRLSSK